MREQAGAIRRTSRNRCVCHAAKPGIARWAQICCGYGSTNEDSHVQLEYDLYYLMDPGLQLDLRSMLLTRPVMLPGKGQ